MSEQRPSAVTLLKLAGISSSCVSALHVLIILLGGPAYRYFGAGERMARLADYGSAVPTVLTAAAAVVFAAWAAYAFAGAGMLKRPPFLRTGLILSGCAYVLRGILIGPQLVWWVAGYRAAVPPRQLGFSVVALVTGMAYLAGTKSAWRSLSPRRQGVDQR